MNRERENKYKNIIKRQRVVLKNLTNKNKEYKDKIVKLEEMIKALKECNTRSE